MALIACVLSVIAVIWGACVQYNLGKLAKSVVVFNAVALILTFVGMWFKIAHWPGANIICLACFGVLLPVAVICTAVSYSKNNK